VLKWMEWISISLILISMLVSLQIPVYQSQLPPDVLLPAHEAENPSGDPNILLPADVIMDPQAPSDGCNTPDIDFSFMYQTKVSHDLWVTLDDGYWQHLPNFVWLM
jgi:hypothetical protein